MKHSKKRWLEALEEAGLTDNPETRWELSEDGSRIKVDVDAEPESRLDEADRRTPPAPPGYLQERETVESPPTSSDLDFSAYGERRKEPKPAMASETLNYGQEKGRPKGPSAISAPKGSRSASRVGGGDAIPEGLLGDTLESLASVNEAMRDCFQLGDYSGALEKANAILAANADDAEARTCKGSCEDVLLKMYQAKIGSFDRKPKLMVGMKDITLRKLDHKTGFILSFVDGQASFEEILDMSGLSRFDTCRILNFLLEERIIE